MVTLHRCPDCRCTSDDDRPPQPSTSSTWARKAAIEAAEAAVKAAKDKRLAAAKEGKP